MGDSTADHDCRLCGAAVHGKPLLIYRNMPGAAQNFPDAGSLDSEHGQDIEVFQCACCGLVQLLCRPVPYFREVIRAAAYSDEMRAFRQEQFAGFVNSFELHRKKVLEVGAGRGEYLELMSAAGADATGLEYSESSVSVGNSAGLSIVKGFVEGESYRIPQAPFAAFYTLNFLEHVPRLGPFLKGICNNLEDDGVGLVEAPNFDMILEKRLFSEFIPDHLTYFTRQTLETALRMNGFDVLDCKPVWYDYILSAQVRKRAGLDMSEFSAHQEKVVREITCFLERFSAGRVAVWGAGHQALAMLSLAGMSGKVRYVVDSAPFKQNRFTPATHIPIVSPEMLADDPVEAVIIMAASYSDEVNHIIKRDYSQGMITAILRDYGLEISA